MNAIDNPARTKRAQAARAFLIGSLAASTWIGTVCCAQTAPQGPTQQEAGLPKLTYSANALTLQQIQDIAATRNPALLAARQNLEGVRAQEIQAGVRANPYFTLYGIDTDPGVIRVSGSAGRRMV